MAHKIDVWPRVSSLIILKLTSFDKLIPFLNIHSRFPINTYNLKCIDLFVFIFRTTIYNIIFL